MDQVRVFKEVLDEFCSYSGSKVSTNKSIVIFSKNVTRHVTLGLEACLGFRVANSSGRYLGVWFTEERRSALTFQPLTDKIRACLSGLNANSFSLAGRITLVELLISSIPYYMT